MPVYGIRMNMINTFKKSEIIKEERKKEERNRDSSGGCLASWLNLHLSGRCTVLRKPEDCFFSEMLWFQFSLSAWRYIFLSRVCLALGFTLHDNYTSAVVCLHLLFLVSCTVITKSRVPRKVHWFHWFECDFCWLHYIFTRGGGVFPLPTFLCLLEVQTVSNWELSHITGQIVLWIRIAVLCIKV